MPQTNQAFRLENTYLLCIETSARECSIALSDKATLISYKQSEGIWKHSKEITLHIESVLKGAGVGFDELSAIAVSEGPGSYTGLRVGVSAAKAISYAKSIPLIGISTLKIIANEFKSGIDNGDYIIATIDARRDEIFYQIFNHHLEVEQNPTNHILTTDSFSGLKDKKCIICGDAAIKTSDFLKNKNFQYKSSFPSAKHMLDLAYTKFRSSAFADTAYFSPFYLKSPNITKSKKTIL